MEHMGRERLSGDLKWPRLRTDLFAPTVPFPSLSKLVNTHIWPYNIHSENCHGLAKQY